MKISSLKTILMAIFIIFAITAQSASYSGSCGSNLTWIYNTDSGALKIRGTGSMQDYSSSTTLPWSSFTSEIKSVEIPEGVTSIGDCAFQNCTALTSVTIPNSVTEVGYLAFDSCTGLTSIEVASENSYYASENGVLFDKNKTTLIQYPSGMQKKQYMIPRSVTTIESFSFKNNSALVDLYISDSMAKMGYFAIAECPNLTNVYVSNIVPPMIDSESFYGVCDNATLYVPVGSKEDYQNVDVWNSFSNIKEVIFDEDGYLESDKIIINHGDNETEKYRVDAISDIKFSKEDELLLSTTDLTVKYPISKIDSITVESQDLTSLILVSDEGENKYDLSAIEKIEFGYSTPHVIADSIFVSVETIKLAPSSTTKFEVDIVKKEYLDEDIYPLYALIEKVSTNSVSNPATVSTVLRADSTGYDIKLSAGSEKAEYICKLIMGDYEKDIPISVDYGVYLSHNIIEPDYLNNVGLLTYKTISLGETLDYLFFCYLDGATDAQKAAIKEKLLNVNNYKITPAGGKYNTLSLEVGDITINDASEIWTVNVPLTSVAKSYEQGIVSLTIEDKTLDLNLTCDDGKHFSELYISFEQIYTYSEETKTGSRKLDNSYLKYIGGNNVSTEKERFKVIVWYTMSPDDRGDYIKWNLNMPLGENAPVKYIGMQKLNTQQYEFEFEVNAAGEANVEFTIENPKADDPSLSEEDKEFYEKYRKQTVTAMINVIDRNTVEVESVVFVDDPDPLEAYVIEKQETSVGLVPLYTYILPEESAGPWPSIFTLECKDGAEATVKQAGIDEITGEEITPEVSITHAGTIIVTATSKDKTATLEITAKLKIDQIVQGDKLQLQTSRNEYAPGETDKIKTTLRSSYKVNDDEYTWVSSNPDVVTVDAYGNITAVSDGFATITVSITDAYGYTATATKEVSVRSVNADANLDDAKWDEYYVIDLGEGGIYYIDTEEGSSDLFTLNLSNELSGDGVYYEGADFIGTIQFPTNDIFDIVGGTITISGGKWTFDLQISDGTISGTVTGTKEYMFIEW